MRVIPTGEKLRFWVESETPRHRPYLVDVMADHAGVPQNGVCNCPHFEIGLQALFRTGKNAGQPLRCKHIRAAREFALSAMLGELSRIEKEPKGK